jgi:glycosyltransferase involved in cell wall biosynthesis
MIHHPLALESGLSSGFSHRLRRSEQRALAVARAAIVTSETTAATLIREFGVPADKITVAKPGVDLPSMPRQLAAAASPVRLLSVGTITPRKSHAVLIRALSRIAALDWQSIIVGSLTWAPETVAELKALIAREGLSDRIDLVGEVRDPAPYYHAADIFVLPSRYEGYGMVFAEAVAHGLPVVSTDGGAIPEVAPQAARILVPVDDDAALAEALRRLITEPELRLRLAAGAETAAATLPRWADSAAIVASALSGIEP